MTDSTDLDARWSGEIEAYGRWMRGAGQSAGTIRLWTSYLVRLGKWAGDRPPWELATDDLADYLAAGEWKAETRKSARSAICGFYAWALTTDRVSRDPARTLPRVRVPVGVPKPTPEAALLEAYRAADDRVRLMLVLAAFAGLRRAEIAGLHTDDIEPGFLRITGKGGKVRRVPIHPEILDRVAELPRGWVFPSRGAHISANRVGELLTTALAGRFTAHTLRHRFASQAYRDGVDIAVIQRLMGHSRPETTMRYTQVPDDDLVTAVLGLRGLEAS